MPVDARNVSLKALERIRRDKAWSRSVIDSLTAEYGLDARDNALAANICLGVLRNLNWLDYCIDLYLKPGSKKLHPKVRDILRISACQILFMDKIPVSAAVSQGVELCRANGQTKACGLVNAVLRRIAENKDSIPEPCRQGTPEYLAVRYSHPLWLAEYVTALYGDEFARSFFEENNRPAPTFAQVNTMKLSAEEFVSEAVRQNIEIRKHDWLDNCFEIGGDYLSSELFRQGGFYIQDPAARLAAVAADIKGGDCLLDACAAPGGKSFAAAIAMRGEGKILSCDINKNKLRRIETGAQRLGIENITVRDMDARYPDKSLEKAFDVVLADVPCSGIGVIRKKPEIRYKEYEDISALPQIQLDILRGLSCCVKPGGVILYSTCTVISEENGGVVSKFLIENTDFSKEDFSLPKIGTCGGDITLWPQTYGTDGFYICKLRRKA